MTKYQQLFIRQFDDTLQKWRMPFQRVKESELYRFCHSIKGTAATIGFAEWSEAASGLLNQLNEEEKRIWPIAEIKSFIQPFIQLRQVHEETDHLNNEKESETASTLPIDVNSVKSAQFLVLLVDDDIALLRMYKERLEEEGCMVLATPFPEKAIKWFYELKPDCIVLDIHLPGKDGFELLSILQERTKRFVVPVLLCSAQNDKSTRMRAYASGADDFLPKPMDADEFVIRVMNKLLRKQNISKAMLKDELTGLYNLQYMRNEWQRLVRDYEHDEMPFYISLLDVDQFKKLNAHYGHTDADAFLFQASLYLSQHIQTNDLLVRWEQDRFLLITRELPSEGMEFYLNQIAASFYSNSFQIGESETVQSVSITYIQAAEILSFEHCLNSLMNKMTQLKASGISQVQLATVNMLEPVNQTIKIGIVDDDPIIRNMLEHRLQDIDINGKEKDIRTFADGSAFLEDSWHREGGHFLIILDRMMPRLNGMEVLSQLRAQFPAEKYRILMLTGIGEDEEIAQALRSGTDDYMTKPFRLFELEARIQRLLQGMSK